MAKECPECGHEAMRPLADLGLDHPRPEFQSWMFKQAPLGLGLAAVGIAGWSMIVFFAMVAGVTSPTILVLIWLFGAVASVRQAMDLASSGPGPGLPAKELCLFCHSSIARETNAYFPVRKLSAPSAEQAFSSIRLRSLARAATWAQAQTLAVIVFLLLAGCASLAGALWTWSAELPRSLTFPLAGFSVMALGMGAAFLKLWKPPVLLRARFRPRAFAQAQARLSWVDPRGNPIELGFRDEQGREISVLLKYRGNLDFLAPPLDAWVVYEKADPWNAALAGLRLPDS